MKNQPILIKGGRVIDPASSHDAKADVLIKNGTIASVAKTIAVPDGARVIDASNLVVAPGFIDLHTHLREPGFEDKETVATGTRAAAKGGFTTLCAMPNTKPPADNPATIDYVLRKAREEGVVRVLPIGCVTKASAGKELAEMGELAQAGAVAFSDDGNPVSDDNLMRQALAYASAFDLPISNHCEVDELFQGGVMNEGWVATRLGLRGVPNSAEEVMVARDISLAALTGGRIHLAHISTAGTVELVRRAKEQGISVTCEVTPHHLTITEQAVLGRLDDNGAFDPLDIDSYNTYAKVNPPLRTRKDVDAVVQGLKDGIIDIIATDHAPHNRVDKLCPMPEAAFGISVLETALGSVLSLAHNKTVGLPRIVEALTSAPAAILKRTDIGTLKKGAQADVVIFDPDASWTVDPSKFASKGKNTPLGGATLKGLVTATIFNGSVVYEAKS